MSSAFALAWLIITSSVLWRCTPQAAVVVGHYFRPAVRTIGRRPIWRFAELTASRPSSFCGVSPSAVTFHFPLLTETLEELQSTGPAPTILLTLIESA